METPFGGYQQKPIVTPFESESKVIHKQPVEKQNTPAYATPQPQSVIIKESRFV